MKNLLIVFSALLVLASCRKKGEEPIAVESVSLRATASVVVNSTQKLEATISPPNASDKSLTWAIDGNSDLATVDQDGVVTGKSVGKVIIKVTSKSNPDKSAKCEVQVVKEKAASVTITPENPIVLAGETLQLKAAVHPADASQDVTWSSKETAKATIDPSTGVVTGVAAGETVITAEANDGSGTKGEIKLTVQIKPASITAITLGDEKFSVRVPADGATTTVANIPRTLAVVEGLDKIKVNITKGDEQAAITIGTAAFTQGQAVDFSSAVTFTVTALDKTIVKKYTVAITPYDGKNNPYGIYTVKHLVNVNSGLGDNYLVKNDINLPNIEAADADKLTGIGDYATNGWQPLGWYKGELFDGGGHSINNFYFNRSGERTGLFELLDDWSASIKNLGVNCRENTTSKGGRYTGILVGYNDQGVIDNCFTTGKVESYNGDSGESYAGGLVGYMVKGNINTSYSTADISAPGGRESCAGGLVGYIDGDPSTTPNIQNCYATGDVSSSGIAVAGAGGLVGWTKSGVNITNCYATGNISSSRRNSAAAYTGGLVGGATYFQGKVNPRNSYRNSSATLTKNGTVVTVSDDPSNGDLVITPKTYAEMQKDEFKDLLKNGKDGSVWGRADGKNNNLPYITGVGVGK